MKTRLPQLDGLKIFFCFAVVMWHYYANFAHLDVNNAYNLIPNIVYRRGYLGVEFFFMVSGFFIAHNYKEHLNEKKISAVFFVKKRFISLYPMYFVACSLGMILAICDRTFTNGVVTGREVNIYNSICSFTMTANGWAETGVTVYGGSMWFIGILMICYIIYGFIASIFTKQDTYIILLLMMIFLGWYLVLHQINIIFLYNENGRGYLSFFIGCLLYEIQTKVSEKRLKILSALYSIIICIHVLYGYGTGGGNG